MLRLRRPTAHDLDLLLQNQRDQPFTYEGVGGTLTGEIPDGYRYEEFERVIGDGDSAFGDARSALADWRPHRGSGVTVVSSGPIETDTTVALAAPLPIGFVMAACRVVAVVDEPHRYGFAYGTLPTHPQSGEESFVVERAASGSVTFRISVFSKPHELLAHLTSPIARFLQRRATSAYLDAMGQAGRFAGGGRGRP